MQLSEHFRCPNSLWSHGVRISDIPLYINACKNNKSIKACITNRHIILFLPLRRWLKFYLIDRPNTFSTMLATLLSKAINS